MSVKSIEKYTVEQVMNYSSGLFLLFHSNEHDIHF